MAKARPHISSPVYRRFREIPCNAHQERIRYVERFEGVLHDLRLPEEFEMRVALADSLFAVGAYARHIFAADWVIEQAITHNIFRYQRRDIYREMLLYKAASLYQTMEYVRAENLLRQFLRMHPEDKVAANLMRRCLKGIYAAPVYRTRGLSVLLILVTAVICVVELMLVRPFYPMEVETIVLVRNFVFGSSLSILIFGELRQHFLVRREVATFVRGCAARKARS